MELEGDVFIPSISDGLKIIHAESSLRVPIGNVTVRVRGASGAPFLRVGLPKARKAAGSFVSVYIEHFASATFETAIEDAGDTNLTDIVLDNEGEYSCLFCDGLRWYELRSYHA
jgi:hypothetical protein